MMKTGWRTRYACILLMALMPVLPGFAQFWLEVKHLNDSKKLIKSPAVFRVVMHEMIGIEFVGHYENESDDVVQTCWLRRTNGNIGLPDYIEGWIDREQLLRPGEATTLSNIVYIQPTSTGWDSLYIEAAVRQGQYPHDPIKANRFKIYFFVSNTSFDTPKIIIEPEYTRGLSNTISWLPADGSLGQDVYYFDKANPIELKRSVQKLYRPVLSDTMKTTFEGLIHQHQYGYFVKAVYETADGPLYLHSDIVYSTQDNVQPQTVISPQVLIATLLLKVIIFIELWIQALKYCWILFSSVHRNPRFYPGVIQPLWKVIHITIVCGQLIMLGIMGMVNVRTA